jgi:hypothetical protein
LAVGVLGTTTGADVPALPLVVALNAIVPACVGVGETGVMGVAGVLPLTALECGVVTPGVVAVALVVGGAVISVAPDTVVGVGALVAAITFAVVVMVTALVVGGATVATGAPPMTTANCVKCVV